MLKLGRLVKNKKKPLGDTRCIIHRIPKEGLQNSDMATK